MPPRNKAHFYNASSNQEFPEKFYSGSSTRFASQFAYAQNENSASSSYNINIRREEPHLNLDQFKCPMCNISYGSRSSQRRHIRTHHPDIASCDRRKPQVVTPAAREATRKRALKNYYATHHDKILERSTRRRLEKEAKERLTVFKRAELHAIPGHLRPFKPVEPQEPIRPKNNLHFILRKEPGGHGLIPKRGRFDDRTRKAMLTLLHPDRHFGNSEEYAAYCREFWTIVDKNNCNWQYTEDNESYLQYLEKMDQYHSEIKEYELEMSRYNEYLEQLANPTITDEEIQSYVSDKLRLLNYKRTANISADSLLRSLDH